jgi:hypothetical protein
VAENAEAVESAEVAESAEAVETAEEPATAAPRNPSGRRFRLSGREKYCCLYVG